MLALLPVTLLVISAAVIQVVGRVTRRAGSTWLLAAVFGFITWLSMILVGILLPEAVTISDWMPEPNPFSAIIIQATRETWVFGFLLLTSMMAVIFFNARYLDSANYLNRITGAMILTAFGMLAVFSRSPLAFVLAWSLMDLAEFGVLTATIGNVRIYRPTLTVILFREAGIILLVLLMSITNEIAFPSETLKLLTSWLLLLIVLSRMGILPIVQAQTDDPRIRRGFLTLLRMLPFIAAFSYITTLPSLVLPEKTTQLLLVIFSISGLYGSLTWFFSRDEITARPHWFYTLGSLGLVAFLSNNVDTLTALAVVAVSAGAGIFLYTPRFNKIFPYLPLLLLPLMVLPFTPTAPLQQFFAAEKLPFHSLLLVPTYALLIAGLLKHAIKQNETQVLGEPWIGLFYKISLYFIALVPWILLIVMFKSIKNQANWWVSFPILLLTAGFGVVHFMLVKRPLFATPWFSKISPMAVKVIRVIDQVFRLKWLSKAFSAIGFITSKAANLLIRVQEGDGGILWSFLLLVLLLSLLITRQAP